MASAKAANSSRQKLAKRACDPCKVRKIKCSEVSPCNGCISAGIECTFNKAQAIRGPRNLRTRTIDKINRAQRGQEAPPKDASSPMEDGGTETLVDLLDIYATRLYPIWPIVDIEQLSSALQAKPRDEKAHHLAEAVALATVAQLKLTSSCAVSAQKVEQDQRLNSDDIFESLRVSFFLHIYHENQSAGGVVSLLYLREAITKAQILGIDRESFFAPLEESEQQVYRRTLWLLFVTERGVAMLHKLPVVLKPNTMFPWFGRTNDHFHVLPAFLKLVHLFWIFDQSGIFELLRNSDSDVSSMEALARSCLGPLQEKLHESAADDIDANHVQRADILVTRQWMRAVLWRAALRFGIVVPDNHPVDVADEFLRLASQLPKTALESQGPTLEFKTFEIATAVVDALASSSLSRRVNDPHKVLLGLQRILSSSRGGNKALLSLLNTRIAAVAPDVRLLPQPSTVAESHDAIFTNDMMPEAIDWSMLTQTTGIMPPYLDEPNYHSIEQQMAQMSWPPLDLGNLMGSQSPMTQVLMKHPVETGNLI